MKPWLLPTRWPRALTAKTTRELALNHGHATVRWRTYDAGGTTSLDFACATAVDALLATPQTKP